MQITHFFYISVQFANYLMSVVFGTQVTYIIFFDFSGEKRDIEHIRSLGYIAGASIFIDDFNTVILLLYILFSILDMDRKYSASFLLIFSCLLILERISSFRAFVMEEEVTSTLNSFLLIIPRLRVDNTTSL